MAERVSTCPVCSSADVDLFMEVPQVPLMCSVFWPTHEEAVTAPRGKLELGFCHQCGHIYNYAFDSKLLAYDQAYDNSLHFSSRFREYADELAGRLIQKYDLYQKNIVEIGCGKGEFLEMLCAQGRNRGLGFDPSYEPERRENGSERPFTVVQDLYSEKYAGYPADLLCCQHVLEHIDQPRPFMQTVRRAVEGQRDTVLYFEVPNVLFTLDDLAIWDLIYPHCSYFSSASLTYLFEKSGFGVAAVDDAFDGQFLYVEAFPGRISFRKKTGQVIGLEELREKVETFAQRYQDKVESWRKTLAGIQQAGERAVIWGAGAKGVTILNILDAREGIEFAVDINPRKEGLHVPGTGQPIVMPAFLKDYRPDVVIMMNSIYEEEIRRQVNEMGLAPRFLAA